MYNNCLSLFFRVLMIFLINVRTLGNTTDFQQSANLLEATCMILVANSKENMQIHSYRNQASGRMNIWTNGIKLDLWLCLHLPNTIN